MDVIKTPKVENVRLVDRYNRRKVSMGTLYLTATHLIFVDPDNKKETWIQHSHIGSVEKLSLSTSGCPLHIRCKTFLIVTFIIPKERDCHNIYTSLCQLSQPVNVEDLYCFHYTSPDQELCRGIGWNFFDLQAEYQRFGIPNEHWTLSNINKDYELCDTYPRILYVPSSASTPVLVGSSKFRSRGRLPILSYVYRNKASICRCSQPLVGFSARCMEDEHLLNCILHANPNADFMYVVDTRPMINAVVNRAAGKGYEKEDFYANIKFQFMSIENIHVMRSSLAKLLEACELKSPSMSSFLDGLASSGWLKHIKSILETGWFVAKAVAGGISVLVHCSDGWDRTAQVCALAQLFLDSHYRTIQGFQALIEKEWLSFGHKFLDRCGLISMGEGKDMSPIFTQFLEAVWQVMMQRPQAFQFNERFLIALHDHAHSAQYGTFVGNCEKDRVDLRVSERTYSLWGFMATHANDYVNPLYVAETAKNYLLQPCVAPQALRFWRGLYTRFEAGVHPRDNLDDIVSSLDQQCTCLEEHTKLLNKRISMLKDLLTKYKETKSARKGTVERESKEEKNGLVLGANPPSLKAGEQLTGEQLAMELSSVSLDWKSLRNVTQCSCSTAFDNHSIKQYHCWSCGEIFCMRCIDTHAPLPGLNSQRDVPVCRPCFSEISRSPAPTP